MRYPLFYIISAFLTVLTMSSCFKDTDFDQADNVVVRPVVALNLIFFDINATRFYDEVTNTPILVVRDTTALELLDSDGIDDVLIGAEFSFNFTNSIPRDFNVSFDFLNDINEVRYSTSTLVNEGTINNPVETISVDLLDFNEINEITSSNKVVVSVAIPQADSSLLGNLNLQSKTTYFLELN